MNPKYIESKQNSDYKSWLNLARGAKNFNSVLLEGEHLCQSWLSTKGQPDVVLIDENLLDQPNFADIWHKCEKSKKIILHKKLANNLLQVQHGLGIFFVVPKPIPILPASLKQNIVCLDRVQDPGNLGTLLRTSAAAGISNIFLSKGCAHAWSPKVLRSGQGAHFAVNIYEQIDILQLADKYSLGLACTILEKSQNLYDADLTKPCAWVFGNEGQGVAKEIINNSSLRLRIDQSDSVESLNVAAAAAICLFEQRRQQQINK